MFWEHKLYSNLMNYTASSHQLPSTAANILTNTTYTITASPNSQNLLTATSPSQFHSKDNLCYLILRGLNANKTANVITSQVCILPY